MGETRMDVMVSMFSDGKTLQEIGDVFGISRQRVSWLFAREGVVIDSGGYSKKLIAAYGFESANDFEVAKNKYPGCVKKFRQQRSTSRARKIKFLFTLKGWLEAWGTSWENRGIGGDSLVMCRLGDVGPYAPGNVYIATCGQNAADYQAVKNTRFKVDKGC